MADPLSVAASIIAVLQLAQSVVQGIQTIKDSSKERKTVRDEVIYLSGLLFNLKGGLERHELNQELLSSLNAPVGPLSQLKDALEQLSKLLIPSEGLKKVGHTISWTFQKEKIDDLLRKIDRQKTSILFALENNQLDLSHNIRRDVQQLKDGMDNIQNAVSKIDIHLQETLDETRMQLTEETLVWLSPMDFTLKHRDIQSKIAPGTCQWFLLSPEFERWRSGKWSTLWCTGPPGVGKSFLASAIVTYLQQNMEDDEALAYVYCDYKNKTIWSADILLASILQQLSLKHTFVREAVSTLYAFHRKRRTRPVTSQWLELLRQEFQLYSKVFLVIDALDEYGETEDDRHALIASIMDLRPQMQLLVTSRVRPSRDLPIDEEQIKAITGSDGDISTYLVAEIPKKGRLSRLLSTDDAITKQLIHSVIQSASGMFLLAKLQLDLLAQSHTKRILLKNLETLPVGLDQLYEQTISRILEQGDVDGTLARNILTLLACAYRPLSLSELQHALALQSDGSDILSAPLAEKFDAEDAVDRDIILSVCLGLVTIQQEDDEVRLIHSTLQSYLDQDHVKQWPDARANIARTCLASIKASDLTSGPCNTDKKMSERLAQYPFLGYAGRYWGRHIHDSAANIDNRIILEIVTPDMTREGVAQIMHLPRHDREVVEYTATLNESRRMKDSDERLKQRRYSSDEAEEVEVAQIEYSQLYPRHVTALQLASSFGLATVVRTLLQSGSSIHGFDSYGWTALHRACENGHIEVAKMLLDLSADAAVSAEQGGTALHRAAKKGHMGIVELLASKTPIDSQDQTGATPLHRAARHGHLDIARRLLQLGANINACQTHMESVEGNISYWLSEHYSHSFDQDAMTKYQRVSGGTPLHEAAANGHLMVTNTLIDAHARLNFEDTYGGHPLHRAAAEGHVAVVESLIRAGAELNHDASCTIRGNPHKQLVKSHVYYIMDKFWGTPLHLASRHGHLSVVEKLIGEGATLEIRDSLGQTPLSTAASAGQASVVELLLRHGCCVDGSVAIESDAEESDCHPRRRYDRTDHKFNGYTASSKKQALRKVDWAGESPAIATLKVVEGLTPLHDAAWYGHLEVVKLLVENGAPINQRDALGRTSILLATLMKNVGIVMLLTQHGADISLGDSQGSTPLSVVCGRDETDLTNFLLDTVADVAAEEISSDLLLSAAKAKNWPTMQLLFERGARPILFKNIADSEIPESYFGWDYTTAMRWPLLWHTCQSGGEAFFIKLFAQAPPQSIELATKNSLLHRAIGFGAQPLIELLLDHGGDINNCNSEGQSLLELAVERVNLQLCECLISRGINVNIRSSGSRKSRPSCALTEACRWVYGAPFVSLLLDAGADPNNCQPLTHICYDEWENDGRSMTKLLLGYGADPNAQDTEGNTGLLCVAKRSNLEAIELMLTHGGDPEIRNNNGETSISRAIDEIVRPRYGSKVESQECDKIIIALMKHCVTPKNFEDRHNLLESGLKVVLEKANRHKYARRPLERVVTPKRLRHWASLGEEPL